jgi:hypothetical protein
MHYSWRENSISHVELECECAATIAGSLVWKQLPGGPGACLDGE